MFWPPMKSSRYNSSVTEGDAGVGRDTPQEVGGGGKGDKGDRPPPAVPAAEGAGGKLPLQEEVLSLAKLLRHFGFQVGLDAVVKPLLSCYATEEFDSPPKKKHKCATSGDRHGKSVRLQRVREGDCQSRSGELLLPTHRSDEQQAHVLIYPAGRARGHCGRQRILSQYVEIDLYPTYYYLLAPTTNPPK
eukprot:1180068-Prorocentrum_minimum.AAC.1